jgi:hypothetical protein
MTEHDDGAAVYSTAVARRNRRRKQVVAGVAGLAAILGGGAFFVTEQLTNDNDKVVTNTGAQAPLAPAASASAARSGSPSASAPTPRKSAASASHAAATPKPRTTAERIAAARGKAAKAADQVRRPLPPNGNVTVADGVTITNSGSLKKQGATLRLVSARTDLTGLRELAWAADDGVPVGDARCTQNFHFSGGAPAAEKPTLLLCWRTSPAKSVYTVAVVLKGRPSTATSVDAIDKQWTKLG